MSTSLKRDYVSELDQFLQDFDQQHPVKSASQQREIAKHKNIAEQRDHAIEKTSKNSEEKNVWEKF
jgi:hypothetical protein